MSIKDFGKSATSLSKNPLSIISLFLVLLYVCAVIYIGFSGSQLESNERFILLWFLALATALVLVIFAWLVSKQSDKLYAPTDFKDDSSFLQLQRKGKPDVGLIGKENQVETEQQANEKNDRKIDDLMSYGAVIQCASEIEENIKKDFISRGIDITGEASSVLIHQLAVTQYLHWFERVYRIILGNQIHLLKLINEQSSKTIIKRWAVEYFGHIQNSFEDLSSWTSDDYLYFLFAEGLIIEEADGLLITVKGNDFLTTMARFGYSEKRVLL